MANGGGDDPDQSDQVLTLALQLQSRDHEEMLNAIDQLRSEGISRYVNLPQLVVCGDQSSGKSSVLEAISGLGFPVKDNLCTRFATELILRRSPNMGVTASIFPDEDRPAAEKERIRGFKSSTRVLENFAAIVEEAGEHIGVGQDGHGFSKDVLRVEVSGPTQPHLTLVDLPGLYHAPDELQGFEGVDFVESLNHILSELPGLIAETQRSVDDTRANLRRLGEARQTLVDQRRYLLHSSEKFTSLIGDAINGFYVDSFFGDAMEEDGYQRRLRAVVQNRLSDFSEILENEGMQRNIVDDDDLPNPESSCMLRSTFVDEVQQRMRRSRGRELPGTFNPLIIGDLFYLQSKPWESIVTGCIDALLEDVQKTIVPILRHVLDEKSLNGLMEHVLDPALDDMENSLREKTRELLKPQQSGHPITYNHYFTDGVQKARGDHLRRSITEKLMDFFADQYPGRESTTQRFTFKMDELIEAVGTETEASMERFAASEAVDCMQAYYKVARKNFVDEFSTLAVEKRLLDPLAVMFSPRVLERLADEKVDSIASEDLSTKVERERLEEKSAKLQSSLKILHRLDRNSLSASKASGRSPVQDGDNLNPDDNLNMESPQHPASPVHSGTIRELGDNSTELYSPVTPQHESPEESAPVFDGDLEANFVPTNRKKKKHSRATMWD